MTTDSRARAEIVQELSELHGFDELDVLLLPLVPLVEMVVADGRVQQAEIDILKDYTLRLLVALKEQSDGMAVVPKARAADFINRMLCLPPNSERIKRLRHPCLRLIQLDSNARSVAEQERTLLEYCLDIAAASVVGYPYSIRGRVVQPEKRLLAELIRDMKYTERFVSAAGAPLATKH